MKHQALIIGSLLALVIGVAAYSSTTTSASGRSGTVTLTGTPLPASRVKPHLIPTPPDNRTVLSLDLVVTSSSPQQVTNVTQKSCRVVRDWSNGSLYSKYGQWTVELLRGGHSLKYMILDPRYENVMPTAKQPGETVFLPTVAFRMFVPLFDNAKELQVHQVDIFDKAGHLIYSVGIQNDACVAPAQTG